MSVTDREPIRFQDTFKVGFSLYQHVFTTLHMIFGDQGCDNGLGLGFETALEGKFDQILWIMPFT